MVRKRYLLGVAAVVLGLVAGGSYAAGVHHPDKHRVKADRLTGFQEPPAVFSNGTGSFRASIDDSAKTITFEEHYSGLSAPATASHIHFGNRFTNGGVVAFLCGGGGKPACPAGTTSEATVTGTIVAANVLAQVPNQGIPAGGFDQLVKAIRAGVTYVNVHTSTFPGGEIRAQINDRRQRQEH